MVSKEEINGYFLEAVRRLKAKGYTQKDIVEAAGLSQNAISKVKTGQNNAGDDTINKLCNAFKLNPDFFYHGSEKFTLEEIDRPNTYSIDSSSAFNAAIAAHVRIIDTLESQLAAKENEMQARLADKEARIQSLERTIADKEEIIRSRDSRIALLERKLADVNLQDISRYPFSIGAAEDAHEKYVSPKI